MKTREELMKELDLDKLHQRRDDILSYIEGKLQRYNGSCSYYRHCQDCPCADPAVWEMVLTELRKHGYKVERKLNSHSVEYYSIYV